MAKDKRTKAQLLDEISMLVMQRDHLQTELDASQARHREDGALYRRQNYLATETRQAIVDFVAHLSREEAVCQRVFGPERANEAVTYLRYAQELAAEYFAPKPSVSMDENWQEEVLAGLFAKDDGQ